ncbi:MAG: HEPN domain-containing protein [Rhizobium sp.]|nr:HEPN domain-containing protein [Rhizobium sp.]
MDEATRDEAAAWLAIARRDLDSAKRLLTGDPPYRDTAAYHCQQAAEKAIKATDASTGRWEEAAIVLTPYATLYRYPDAFPEPGADDLDEALTLAETLLTDIAERLSRC